MVHYTAPAIEVVGTVRGLTLGNSTGGSLDASFPVGTPYGDLTFS